MRMQAGRQFYVLRGRGMLRAGWYRQAEWAGIGSKKGMWVYDMVKDGMVQNGTMSMNEAPQGMVAAPRPRP